jgi:hypothetical protein
MHKSATKCNETLGKWYKNKHGASKIIYTFETYHMSQPFTLCRGVSFQKRSKPYCTTGRSFPSTLPWCGAQSLIQAIHCLLRTTHAHPIHASRLCPWYSPPTLKYLGAPSDHHRHQWPWALRGPTHMHIFSQDIRWTVAECPLTCEREKIQMTFPSYSKSLGWHGFYGTRRTAALVITPRVYFPVQVEPPPQQSYHGSTFQPS